MKTQQVCKDFLRLHKGSTFDAMEASWMMMEHWGIKIDWHEMADALQYLLSSNEADHASKGFDRQQRYTIK